MSGSFDDKEICLFSISLARNLVQQAIVCAGDDIEEPLDLDQSYQTVEVQIPARMIASEPLQSDTSMSIKVDRPLSQHNSMEDLEEIIDIQPAQIQRRPSVLIERDIEIKTSSSSNKEPHRSDCLREQNMQPLTPVDLNCETSPSLSQYFDKPECSETSIFPFSILGEAPEMLYQRYNREGYLYKKSSSVFLGWQKRYFQVKGFKIYYSKSLETLRERKGLRCINLFVNPCTITEVKGQTFQISIEGIQKKLELKASSIDEAHVWIEFLKSLFKFINENQSVASRYMTMKRQKILKLDVLTEEEFLDRAETGDILLFQSSHMGAKLQRTFTSSKYDHVGLVVKAFDDIYLYDSVLEGGVQLTNWKDFKALGYHSDYVRIAYRKLEIKDVVLREQIQDALFQFASVHTGRKYELNLKKLLQRTSSLPQNAQKNPKKSEGSEQSKSSQEGFFCSELVAAAYKAAGLLDPVIASSRYFPVSFSHKKGMRLLKDAVLSNEYGLAFANEKAKNNIFV